MALHTIETIRKKDAAAEFDVLHLMEAGLPFCTGCSVCFRRGHDKCPHNGIVGGIISRMQAADGVIVLSSTFNMRETALLKNLFDHLCFLLHRPRFFHSKALVLATTGGVGAVQTTKSIAGFLTGIGFNRCYRFAIAARSWNHYEMSKTTANRLEKRVCCFQKDVESKKLHSPSIPVLIPYNLFRGMSLSYTKGSRYETEDGTHWTEADRRKLVYDRSVPVPFPKRAIGQLFYWIGKAAGRRLIVTYRK